MHFKKFKKAEQEAEQEANNILTKIFYTIIKLLVCLIQYNFIVRNDILLLFNFRHSPWVSCPKNILCPSLTDWIFKICYSFINN